MKSNASDHLELVQAVYIDACARCTAHVSDLRDLETIRSRVKDEGLSFLTITLPSFCKDFERSLALGFIDSSCFQGFRKHGAIPAFLQGMLSQIFDRETGRILDEDDDTPTVVGSIRQVCLFFKKVQLPCTPERDAAALANFKEVEQVNKDFELLEVDRLYFNRVASVLWDNMLADIQLGMLVPRHGPGATAEGISGNAKYVWRRWYDRLEPFFPLLGNAYPIGAYASEELHLVSIVPEQDEQPVKVTLVPKTLKTPRIIAIEPVCMQYAQQAIQTELYARIEEYPVTAGHVNFTDQSVNQAMALEASRTGQFSTIDLSDASDRVLNTLALSMFDCNPDLRDAIDACRSRTAKLPDGSLVGPLVKFASMGSALCFPVESMYFYTICVGALLATHNLPVTHRNVFDVSRFVYVYGDDIIVPTDSAVTVLDHLKKYNCKVNTSKTFYTGRFRESCGVDAYGGTLVTPVYLRRERPRNRQSVASIASWCATANDLYLRGYWHTAQLMYTALERVLGESLPYVSPDAGAIGRISYLNYRSIDRWNEDYQRWETRAFVVKGVDRSDRIDGYSALSKCLLSLERRSRGIEDYFDWGLRHYDNSHTTSSRLHLEQTVRRGSVTLKRRWVSAT